MASIPNATINYFAPIAASSVVTIGMVMIPDSLTGQTYVQSTAANRGTRGSEGIAIVNNTAPPFTPSVIQLMQDGICPAEISLLPSTPGSGKQLVRCSTLGFLERISQYTVGDDVCGYAEESGRVHLHFGLPWQFLANFGVPPSEIPIAPGYFATSQSVFQSAGARKIDMSLYPATSGSLNRTVKFIADIQKTAGATSVECQLYDVTHGAQVADLLYSTNTAIAEVSSAALTVGSAPGNIRNDAPAMYEVSFRMNGGALGVDSVFCKNARLVVTYQ